MKAINTFSKLIGMICISLFANAQDKGLMPGDPAPGLSTYAWLLGDSVSQCEKGTIHVIEFSATWCNPCIKAIPHMQQLAQRYQDRVQFKSLFTFNNRQPDDHGLRYAADVKQVFHHRLDTVAFAVAIDSTDNATAKKWAVTGVPLVFVVDAKGHITWKGHPLLGLDQAIEQVLSGSFDPPQATKEVLDMQRTIENVRALLKRNEPLALKMIDSLLTVFPEDGVLYFMKYQYLLKNDEKAARELLQWMLVHSPAYQKWDDVAMEAAYHAQNPDYRLALQAAYRYLDESPAFLKAGRYQTVLNVYIHKVLNSSSTCEKAIARDEAMQACLGAIAYCEEINEHYFKTRYEQLYERLLSGSM
ncbi:TlpA family protein disulfide reductase [Parapedobacter sp. 2B3]|uniref:TlpA family protein disulfide reductase n=1 Tax=Parapedobacter sp. 2B3 TaxID=3342381 RepID=UPI0035B5CE76